VGVASGFKTGWDSLKPQVMSRLQSVIGGLGSTAPVNLYITGHSLGGALATLAVVDIYSEIPDPVFDLLNISIYAYASPVVGNPAFAQMFQDLFSGKTRGKGFKNAFYYDPNDAIETWANWYLTYTAPAPPPPTYAYAGNVFNTFQGNGHSILNYMTLLKSADQTVVTARPSLAGDSAPAARVASRQAAATATPPPATAPPGGPIQVSSLVLRVYTSPTYEAAVAPGDNIYFHVNVKSDGTGGEMFVLANSNNMPPFQRGYTDTFPVWYPPSPPLIVDFSRCKISKSKSEDENNQWELQGVQILANGMEMVNLSNMFAMLNNNNPYVLFSGLPQTSLIVGVEWGGSHQYDSSGLNPAATMNKAGNVVSVHKAASSNVLNYRRGKMNADETVTWDTSSHEYDPSGMTPSVAMNEAGQLIEVHKGAGDNKLYHRYGTLGDGYKVVWEPSSHEYDKSGLNPRVAIRGNTLVEVHKGASDDELYCHVGILNANGSVTWGENQNYDSSGKNPSVAITADGRVISVHKGASDEDNLYYRVGQINDNLTITWDSYSHNYDSSGETPTVAVDIYGRILEVHKGGGSNTLSYRPGSLVEGFHVNWASHSTEYDSSGIGPVVAINDAGQVLSVHKQTSDNELRYQAGKWIEDPFDIDD
jgi:hypothetical protein